jgi:2-C-methyl-D-erythritol 4-phosphate cytidylyltransferase/2-C-methyl-D-erythritol 2,4-cyclodiphosphate synthase
VITAIIPAAGSGKRLARGINKAFILLGGVPLLGRTARVLAGCSEIDHLLIVAAPTEVEQVNQLLTAARLEKPWQVVAGGAERQHSIANALQALPEGTDLVLVHDGARPLIQPAIISQAIQAAAIHGAAGVAVPVKDTIKVVGEDGFIRETPQRSQLWAIQTPQVFRAELLCHAYAQAAADNYLGTDDAALVERLGVGIKIVNGSYANMKITTPEDLLMAEALINEGGSRMLRMGMGYDVHRLVDGRELILGGVTVPYDHGLEGHSDADVLVHALMDGLLGAAGLGDIGQHFPDSDASFKGASSLALLAKVGQLLQQGGWEINNLDAVIVAEKPKLAPYMDQMKKNIAQRLGLAKNQINVKATTTEGLGFAGRQEGMASYAVVSISGCSIE